MSYKSEFQANNVDLQGLIDTVKTLPIAENLSPELSVQNSLINELNAALADKDAEIVLTLETKDAELKAANASWAGTLTFSGTYATSTYYTAAGCSLAVDKQKGMAFITVQGGTSSSHENVYFTAVSLPEGVTMLTPPGASTGEGFGTGGATKSYFTAVLTGITGKINVAVAMGTLASTSYDAVRCDLTVTYAQPINFTIDGTTYQAESGMTWGTWTESEYNTIGLVIDDSSEVVMWYDADGGEYRLGDPTSMSYPTVNDVVQSGVAYELH